MDAETAYPPLPRRASSRARPRGRHRSPDRLSVPRAAPVLVLAVPAARCPASARITAGVTAIAGSLCPAATIRAGFAGDGPDGLGAVLAAVVADHAASAGHPRADGDTGPIEAFGVNGAILADGGIGANGMAGLAEAHGMTGLAEANGMAGLAEADGDVACPYAAVVVPLAITVSPECDRGVADVAGRAGPSVILAPPLGPHPLLAGALHDRLAEAGLAQPRRISGLALVPTTVGVLVAAAGGESALAAAQTVAVLLAARLGVPVAPVRLGDGDSLAAGVATLREAGASRLAIAPLAVGPEISDAELAAAAGAVGAVCAPALGAHPALGQLVTMRYGAALLSPAQLASAGRQLA